MTPDEEVDELLKKAVARLHAVQDDIYHAGELLSDDVDLYIIGAQLGNPIVQINRLIVDRKELK